MIVKGGGGHGGDCHEPLRHSCQLSRDKNRTKQNLESGKCRLCCMSLHLFFCICEHECRSASVASLFSTRASLRFADRICAMVDQGRGANHQPLVSLFFQNRNNKQTVKRFLIAISNSKTIHHRPVSHRPVCSLWQIWCRFYQLSYFPWEGVGG